MKRILAVILSLTCLFTCFMFTACDILEEDSSEEDTAQTKIVDCKYYDIDKNEFTDKTLLTINILDNYTITPQDSLLSKDPIYQICECSSNKKHISIFEYNDPEFNIDSNIKINNDWCTIQSENKNIKTFYTKKDNIVIGISITNTDKSELTVDNAISAINFMFNENIKLSENDQSNINEQINNKKTTEVEYAEATLNNPAKIGELITFMQYNKESNKNEPIIFSITNVNVDNIYNSEISKYNNIGNTKAEESLKNKSDIIFEFNPITSYYDETYESIIYKYSIYYPNDYTAKNGTIKDPTIEITLCNIDDSSTTINGDVNLYKSVHDFNDVYCNTAKTGETYTGGIGTYTMSTEFKNYLIKINTADGPRYFTPN